MTDAERLLQAATLLEEVAAAQNNHATSCEACHLTRFEDFEGHKRRRRLDDMASQIRKLATYITR